MPATVAVVFYSRRGRILRIANEIAEGIKSSGATCKIFRITGVGEGAPEHFEEEIKKIDPITAKQLVELNPDGIIFGSPGRYGGVCSEISEFLIQLASMVAEKGLFVGKIGSAFTSTGGFERGYGGHEIILSSIYSMLLHFGMVVAGLPCSEKMDVVPAASPYGTVFWGGKSSVDKEFTSEFVTLARSQGTHVGKIANKLTAKL